VLRYIATTRAANHNHVFRLLALGTSEAPRSILLGLSWVVGVYGSWERAEISLGCGAVLMCATEAKDSAILYEYR
jgi:hypothetical protein